MNDVPTAWPNRLHISAVYSSFAKVSVPIVSLRMKQVYFSSSPFFTVIMPLWPPSIMTAVLIGGFLVRLSKLYVTDSCQSHES